MVVRDSADADGVNLVRLLLHGARGAQRFRVECS